MTPAVRHALHIMIIVLANGRRGGDGGAGRGAAPTSGKRSSSSKRRWAGIRSFASICVESQACRIIVCANGRGSVNDDGGGRATTMKGTQSG